jgi:FkbM family methyltransferase
MSSHDRAFIQKLFDAGVAIKSVYDIGASNGQWSAQVAPVLPGATFELFEAWVSPQYAEQLDAVLRNQKNFRVHRFALGRENGTVRLNVHVNHAGNSLIDSDWERIVDKIPIPVRRLDDAVSGLCLPMPDLIKIDVQGFELKILQGGEQACRQAKALMLETWIYRGYGPETPLLHEIVEWLAEREFSLATFGGTWVSPHLKMWSVDAFFVRNDVLADVAARGFHLVGDQVPRGG